MLPYKSHCGTRLRQVPKKASRHFVVLIVAIYGTFDDLTKT